MDCLAASLLVMTSPTVKRVRTIVVSLVGFVTLSNVRRKEPLSCIPQAAATAASRQAVMADVRKARCVEADVRWRWTLNVLYVAAWLERNLWADPTLLNPCILRSRRRVD